MRYCLLESESLCLWVCKNNLKLQKVSDYEKEIANRMCYVKSQQYLFSRGYIRYFLGQLFKLDPLEIPLIAMPGEQPILKKDFGFISLSHTKDALAISWSRDKVGVDLERYDRHLNSQDLLRKFLNEDKHFVLCEFDSEMTRSQILNIWVIKEALIKRENNSIAKGFKDWDINFEFTLAKNKFTNEKVIIKKIKFQDWVIGLACNMIKI